MTGRTLMSLLDVLSGGFGAAILLGLVFSMATPPAAPAPSATDWAQFAFTVDPADSDWPDTFTLEISDPDGQIHDIGSRDFIGGAPVILRSQGQILGEVYGWGFPGGLTDEEGRRRYTALVRTAQPGTWFVGLRFADHAHPLSRTLTVQSALARPEGAPTPPAACNGSRQARLGELMGCWLQMR